MKVLVQRSTGDNPSPEAIIDELCSTENVCEKRGEKFLYDEGFDKLKYEISIPFRQIVKNADIIEVLDSSLSDQFFAKISSLKFTVNWSKDTGLNIKQIMTLSRSII